MNSAKLFFCLTLLLLATTLARAQRFDAPEGEFVVAKIIDHSSRYTTWRAVATNTAVYAALFDDVFEHGWKKNVVLWRAPEGRRSVDMEQKVNGYHQKVLLLDNGDVYIMVIDELGGYFHPKVEKLGPVSPGRSQSFRKVIGDDLYLLGAWPYVTRDNGQTWQPDTSGLGDTFFDIAMDSAQNVYAATTKGLCVQKPGENSWKQVYPHPVISVFVDRHGACHTCVNTYKPGSRFQVWDSTANGSWQPDLTTPAITPNGFEVTKWSDDAYGDLFAINSDLYSNKTAQVYRKRNGTWQKIDYLIDLAAGLPSDSTSTLRVNDIGGDSIVLAATNYGLFSSTDRGDTWKASNDGIYAERIYGFQQDRSSGFVISTSLGIFHTNKLGDPWMKVYPAEGYMPSLLLARAGNSLYTMQSNYPRLLASSNAGATWLPDTLGESAIQLGGIYGDEGATLHAYSSKYGSSFLGLLYEKKPGQPWTFDTLGYSPKNYSFGSAIASDQQGHLFVSGTFPGGAKVMTRAITGGAWSPDTAGLGATINYFQQLVRAPMGVMYGVAGSSIYKHAGSTWTAISMPYVSQSSLVGQVVHDSGRTLYASFRGFDGTGRGIYYYNADNDSWSNAGYDGLDIQAMTAVPGGNVYVATNNGIYLIKPKSVTQEVTIGPQVVDFGTVVVGDSASQIVTIVNTGTETMTGVQIVAPTGFIAKGVLDFILPLDSIKFSVLFKPTVAGIYDSLLAVVIANDPLSPRQITVKGVGTASGVSDNEGSISTLANFPNPFSQSTALRFTPPAREHVTLTIRDMLGHEVARLADGMMEGEQEILWNADALPEGIYVVEVRTGAGSIRHPVALIR